MKNNKSNHPFNVIEVFSGGIPLENVIVNVNREPFERFMVDYVGGNPKSAEDIANVPADKVRAFGLSQIEEETGIDPEQAKAYLKSVWSWGLFGRVGTTVDSYKIKGNKLTMNISPLFGPVEQMWRFQNQRLGWDEEKQAQFPIDQQLEGYNPLFVDAFLISADGKTPYGIRSSEGDQSGTLLNLGCGGAEYSLGNIVEETFFKEVREEEGSPKERINDIRVAGFIQDTEIAYGLGPVVTAKLTDNAFLSDLAHRQAMEIYNNAVDEGNEDSVKEVLRDYVCFMPLHPEEHEKGSIWLPFDRDTTDLMMQAETLRGYKILDEAKGVTYVATQALLEK